MLEVFICEDNLIQRQKIETIITNFLIIEELDMKISLSTDNPATLLLYLDQHPNTKGVYFLDVDLNHQIDGIQLGAKIRNINTDGKIIFITTHNELLALTFTYKVEAMDYIAKDNDRLLRQRIQDALIQAQNHYQSDNKQNADRIKLKIGSQTRVIPLSDVMFFETSPTPHKIELHLEDGSLEFYGKITDISELSTSLKRVHNSFVVNEQNIASIDQKKREIIMTNGEVCLASARLIKNISQTPKT